MIYVQFNDASNTEITGIFAGPQPLEFFPYQGIVEEDDVRLKNVADLLERMQTDAV